MDRDESAASLRPESTSLFTISTDIDRYPSNENSHNDGNRNIHMTNQPTNYNNIIMNQLDNKKRNRGDDSILENTMNTSKTNSEHIEVELRATEMPMTFDYWDASSLVFSMLSFFVDFVTDIAIAIFHYANHDYWYSALTATFVIVPNVITNLVSYRWYRIDSAYKSINDVDNGSGGKDQTCCRLESLMHLFLVGPILRYYRSLEFGIQFKNETDPEIRKKAYKGMLDEDADATLLRLFESFMESAPQLMLQMYIIAKNYPQDDYAHWTFILQIITICSSLTSISWSLVSMRKSLRISLSYKIPMRYSSIAIMFLSEFLSIMARMIALALYTAVFARYVGIVILFHYIVMLAWILSLKTKFCETKYEELCYNAVLGVIFVFCYLNPIDSSTRCRYILFYGFMFVENSILMYFWFLHAPYPFVIREVSVLAHYAFFFSGIIMTMIYYRWFHPIKMERSIA